MVQIRPIEDGSVSRVLDEYLVASARAGDRVAFEHLARRWRRKLVAHAWRLTGDGDAAAEAAQAAWVEIARSLPKLLDERVFAAWVYRIVSRQCARAVAALQADRALGRELAEDAQVAPDEPAPACERDHRRLQQAVRTLPPGQRAAVALFYFEEMSIAEVAVALDVPAGTVKTRLMHARRSLRRVLEGETHA